LVGTGENINFWTDNWLGEPLADLLQIDPIVHTNFARLLSYVIVDGGWNISTEVREAPGVAARLCSIVLPRVHLPDLVVWSHYVDGKLSIS